MPLSENLSFFSEHTAATWSQTQPKNLDFDSDKWKCSKTFSRQVKGFLNTFEPKTQTQSFKRTFSGRDGQRQQQPTQCGRLLKPFSSCCRQKSFGKVNRQNVYSPNLRHQRTASMTPENWWWASVLLLVFIFSLPSSLMCRLWLLLL